MSWLAYAFIGITIWSATAVADRFFLVRHVSSMRFYVAVPAMVQFAAVMLAALVLGIPLATVSTALAAFLSGVAEAVVLYYLYTAMTSDEVSRVFALTTAGPLFTLVLGWLILREALHANELASFGLFLAGGFLLAVRFGQGSFSLSKALKPLLYGSLFTSAFTLLLRFAFVTSDFWTGFFWSRLGFFLGGLFVLQVFGREVGKQWERLSLSARAGVVGNQVVALSGHAFYFLALSLSSAALVQSVMSAQSAIVLLMAAAVAWWRHDLIEESIVAKDLWQKGIGVALVVAASYLLIA